MSSSEPAPDGLETKDLPRGYGHAGTPPPDVLGYNQTTDSLTPVTPVNADGEIEHPAPDGNEESGQSEGANNETPDATASEEPTSDPATPGADATPSEPAADPVATEQDTDPATT